MNILNSTECAHNRNASAVFDKSLLPQYDFFRPTIIEGKKLHGDIPGAPDQMFLHMVHNSFIGENGNIASGELDMIPLQCIQTNVNRTFSNITSHHEEVFITSQYFGSGYYHNSIADMPRIVPYLEFLHRNRHIKVHVQNKTVSLQRLEILGIGKFLYYSTIICN